MHPCPHGATGGEPGAGGRLAQWNIGTLGRWRGARVAAGMPRTGPLFHRSSVPPCRGAPSGPPPLPEPRGGAAGELRQGPSGPEPDTPRGTNRELAVDPRVEANAKLQIVMLFFGLR